MSARERRAFEFRAEDTGAELPTLTGTVLPYGEKARIGRAFTEEFRAGSMDATDVVANVQHDERLLLARTGGGLTLSDGPKAMEARLQLPDTQAGRDAAVLVRDGVLKGFSVEFVAMRDVWEGAHRIVQEARMVGLALVPRPAYEGAVIAEGRAVEIEAWLALQCRGHARRRLWRSL